MDLNSFRRISTLSLPIVIAMLSQNILNLVDIFFVKSLGDTAVAASAMGGFLAFAAVALILGISTGVQVFSARQKGAGNCGLMAYPLNAGLLIVCLSAPFMGLLTHLLLPDLFPLLTDDSQLLSLGSEYVRIRIYGIIFIGVNFAFRGFWNAVDRPVNYLFTLAIMHGANIFLTYSLVFGHFGFPELKLPGAAWGTNLSVLLGTVIHFFLAWFSARPHGFLAKIPSSRDLWQMLKISFPSGVQQLFFACGLVALYKVIGTIGTSELAIASVLTNIAMFAILPSMGMGIAGATLVGQSLGANNPRQAQQWINDICKLTFVAILGVGCFMSLFPEFILAPFLSSAHVVDLGVAPLRLTGLAIAFDGLGVILMYAHLGAGSTSYVMKVSVILQWLIFLPSAYLAAKFGDFSLTSIWLMQVLYRLLQGLIFAWSWYRCFGAVKMAIAR